MNVKESVVLALRSLRAGRLRSLLTSVGIILGVASVIFLVGFSDGMRTKFEREVGDTTRTLRVAAAAPDGTGTGNGVRTPIRERDAAYLQQNLSDDVALVVPRRIGSGVVSNGQAKFRATLQGVPPTYLVSDNRRVIAGRSFTQAEADQKARVGVVSMNVVKYLYGGSINSALGSQVRIGRQTVQVIGVLNQLSAGPEDAQDNIIVMPLSTSRKLMGGTNTLSNITVVSESSQLLPRALREVTGMMDDLRDVPRPAARNYQATFFDLQTRSSNRFIDLFTAFTLGIAALSLLVGGIGVANIMFIAVKERTREIGIRKAIGARRGSIVAQFLTESTILTILGGLLGVVLGVGLVLLGQPLLPTLLPGFGTPEISVPAIVVSLAAAAVIGLVAGVLPALRAARLRPIEALRHE